MCFATVKDGSIGSWEACIFVSVVRLFGLSSEVHGEVFGGSTPGQARVIGACGWELAIAFSIFGVFSALPAVIGFSV